jgi:hypothetical protein
MKTKSNKSLNNFIMAKKSVMLVNETKYMRSPKVTKTEKTLHSIFFIMGNILANKIK